MRADNSAPSAEDGLTEPPADVSRDDLTQTNVNLIALIWRWIGMSAQLATDLDGRADKRADSRDAGEGGHIPPDDGAPGVQEPRRRAKTPSMVQA